MLNTCFFNGPHHIRRLQANPLGAILDSSPTICSVAVIRRASSTSWCARGALRLLVGHAVRRRDRDHVTQASSRQFFHEHLRDLLVPGSPSPAASSPSRARSNSSCGMLDQRDPSRVWPPATPHGLSWPRYDSYLRADLRVLRAHAASTAAERPAVPGATLRRRPCGPDRLRPADLQDYFRRHAGHLKPGSVAVLACSLRSFFRFLAPVHGFDPPSRESYPQPRNGPRTDCQDRSRTRIFRRSSPISIPRTATGRATWP